MVRALTLAPRTLSRRLLEPEAPKDKWNLTYLIFVIQGVGMLMPGNTFNNAGQSGKVASMVQTTWLGLIGLQSATSTTASAAPHTPIRTLVSPAFASNS